jgi:hypothetical protein
MGKTLFAQNLRGRKNTLVLNCANTMEPDLRNFEPAIHQVILFDEASAKMVLKHKAGIGKSNPQITQAH